MQKTVLGDTIKFERSKEWFNASIILYGIISAESQSALNKDNCSPDG